MLKAKKKKKSSRPAPKMRETDVAAVASNEELLASFDDVAMALQPDVAGIAGDTGQVNMAEILEELAVKGVSGENLAAIKTALSAAALRAGNDYTITQNAFNPGQYDCMVTLAGKKMFFGKSDRGRNTNIGRFSVGSLAQLAVMEKALAKLKPLLSHNHPASPVPSASEKPIKSLAAVPSDFHL